MLWLSFVCVYTITRYVCMNLCRQCSRMCRRACSRMCIHVEAKVSFGWHSSVAAHLDLLKQASHWDLGFISLARRLNHLASPCMFTTAWPVTRDKF